MTANLQRHSPAADRNAGPILEVLTRVLPASGLVLEIAAGTGQHAVHIASALPSIEWQPSDVDPDALGSIDARVAAAALSNLRRPIYLDVTSRPWPITAADAVVSINMVHIAPWAATVGLLSGTGRILGADGVLYLYGPFRFDGRFSAPSNQAFDASLRERDPSWGVRDLSEIEAAASAAGFGLAEIVAMPANNHSLVFRRPGAGLAP